MAHSAAGSAAAWGALRDGRIPALGPRGTSLRYWAQRLVAEAQDPERVAELSFWSGMLSAPAVSLVEGALDRGRDISASAGRLTLNLPASVTGALLTRTGAVFHAGINDVLLTGLVLAVLSWCGRRGRGSETAVLIDIEGHGREEIFADVDLSRTLGWFTSLFPMRLDAGALELAAALRGGPALGRAVKSIKQRCVRWRTVELAMGCCAISMERPRCSWRTFPRLRSASTISGVFPHPGGGLGGCCGDGGTRRQRSRHAAGSLYRSQRAHARWRRWRNSDRSLVVGGRSVIRARGAGSRAGLVRGAGSAGAPCRQPGAGGRSPCDLPLLRLSQDEIERIESKYPHIEDILPLSPLQEGLLFHALYDVGAPDVYIVQLALALEGPLDGGGD